MCSSLLREDADGNGYMDRKLEKQVQEAKVEWRVCMGVWDER